MVPERSYGVGEVVRAPRWDDDTGTLKIVVAGVMACIPGMSARVLVSARDEERPWHVCKRCLDHLSTGLLSASADHALGDALAKVHSAHGGER